MESRAGDHQQRADGAHRNVFLFKKVLVNILLPRLRHSVINRFQFESLPQSELKFLWSFRILYEITERIKQVPE